jgi:hypothetical protein
MWALLKAAEFLRGETLRYRGSRCPWVVERRSPPNAHSGGFQGGVKRLQSKVPRAETGTRIPRVWFPEQHCLLQNLTSVERRTASHLTRPSFRGR